jgi:hypothetical protein
MKKAKGIFLSLLLSCILFQAEFTIAGVYSDELSKCIVESSSNEDFTVYVQWIFSLMSLHPAVQSMSSISNDQRQIYNEKCGKLFMNLLTVSCKEQAQKAWKYEGQVALESSFRVLGQVAMRELLSHPKVKAGLSGFENQFDKEKLESVFPGSSE